MIEQALTADVLGDDGWLATLADHRDSHPVGVDALVYLLA